MGFLDNLMTRKTGRLDFYTSDLIMHRQTVDDSLSDVVQRLNNFRQASATYHELRFNYTYINRDLYKEAQTMIIEGFNKLETEHAETLKKDPHLKENVVLIKAELLQLEELWDKVRKEVHSDLIRRQRAAFWKKSLEFHQDLTQNFTENDYQTLAELVKKYGNEKDRVALQNIKKMMSVQYPTIRAELENTESIKEESGMGVFDRRKKHRMDDVAKLEFSFEPDAGNEGKKSLSDHVIDSRSLVDRKATRRLNDLGIGRRTKVR